MIQSKAKESRLQRSTTHRQAPLLLGASPFSGVLQTYVLQGKESGKGRKRSCSAFRENDFRGGFDICLTHVNTHPCNEAAGNPVLLVILRLLTSQNLLL